jgi:N utilization substance protein B
MNQREFREEMIKIIYSDIINPEIDFSEVDPSIKETFMDYKSEIEKLDQMIENHLVNWSIQRLNYVDLAIIRYAVYELVCLEKPKEVVMNEAIELTKKYSNLDDDRARKFNNRLLQNIVDGLSDQDA